MIARDALPGTMLGSIFSGLSSKKAAKSLLLRRHTLFSRHTAQAPVLYARRSQLRAHGRGCDDAI